MVVSSFLPATVSITTSIDTLLRLRSRGLLAASRARVVHVAAILIIIVETQKRSKGCDNAVGYEMSIKNVGTCLKNFAFEEFN